MKRYTALLTLAVLLASCGQQSATPVVTDGPLMIQGELMSTATAILTMPNISAVLNQKLPLAITPTASGFTPVIYTLQPSTLPRGLTFNSRTGAISGTPLILSAPQTYRIIGTQYSPAAQASTTFTLGVVAGLSSTTNPVLLTSTYPSQTLAGGGPFTATPTTQVTGPAMYTLGTLPAGVSGVTLDPNTGVLSGTVIATPGVYVIPVTVTAPTNSPVQSVNTTLTITVTANPAVYPNGNSLTLNELTPFMLAPLADTATQTYTLVSNTGVFTVLTVNFLTGVLSGISPEDPENDDLPNTYTAVVRVTDSAPPAGVAPVFDVTVTFTVNPFIVTYPIGIVTVLSGTGPNPGGNGTGKLEDRDIFPSTVNGSGGVGYARLNIFDPGFVALPVGVLDGAPFFNVDSASGELINVTGTGAPTPGDYQITVRATDSNPGTNRSDTTTVLIRVQGFSLAVTETTTNPNFLPDPANPGTKILTLSRPSDSKITVTSDLLLTGRGLNGFANTVVLALRDTTGLTMPPYNSPPTGVTLSTPNPASMTVNSLNDNTIPLGLSVSTGAATGTYDLLVRGLYTSGGAVGNTNAFSNPFKLRIVNNSVTAPFSQVSAGWNTTCGIGNADTQLYCWGSNADGLLGYTLGFSDADLATQVPNLDAPDSSKPVLLPTGVTGWRSVSVGYNSVCAIAMNNIVGQSNTYCWGRTYYGQLGVGNFFSPVYTSPQPLKSTFGAPINLNLAQISVGGADYGASLPGYPGGPTEAGTACGVSNGTGAFPYNVPGRLYCWGANQFGQSGTSTGTTTTIYTPTPVDTSYGGVPLTFRQGLGTLSVGSENVCAIGADFRAYCWGRNQGPNVAGGIYPLGNGPLAPQNTQSNLRPTLPVGATSQYFLSDTVKAGQVAVGNKTVCMVANNAVNNGEAYCWGLGLDGQLGNGASATTTAPVRVKGVGLTSVLFRTTGMSISGNHVTLNPSQFCALDTTFKALCWGNGDGHALGNGSISDVNVATAVSGNLSFSQISAGNRYTAGLSNNQIYAWGTNTLGRLGLGTGQTQTTPVSPVIAP